MTDGLDDLEIRHLRYFLTVADMGTISGAAEQLRIAQPSLSQQIRRLERRLGLQLFHRGPRGVKLTDSGHVLREGAEQILRRLQSVIEAAGSVPHIVRIGVCSGLTPQILEKVEEVIGTVTDGQESQGVAIREESSRRQADLLVEGDLEFGVVRLPVDRDGLLITTIAEYELGVAMGPGNPLAHRETLTWRDLRHQRLLRFDDHRGPEYVHMRLDRMLLSGSHSEVHYVDRDQCALFSLALRTADDLVALCPKETTEANASLAWRPLIDPVPPRERLGLAAKKGSPHETVVVNLACGAGLGDRRSGR